MSKNSLSDGMKVCDAFAETHVVECCEEIITMTDTAILPQGGKVRELTARLVPIVGTADSQRVAIALVTQHAIKIVAGQGE